MERKLNSFISHENLRFGDFILFQEYNRTIYDGEQYHYKISRPILAIYLGCFVADQTLGFNYVKWNNDNRLITLTSVIDGKEFKFKVVKQVEGINYHIEWDDYVDILGSWKNKPSWKEILAAYRKQNTEQTTTETDFD